MNRFPPPSRDQIARIVGENNPEMIRRFEELFRQSGQETPAQIEGGEASASASEAGLRGMIEEISVRVISEMLAPMPQAVGAQNHVAPLQEMSISSLGDVVALNRENGNLLSWDSQRNKVVLKPVAVTDLKDVDAASLNNGDFLQWDSAATAWKAISGWSGTFQVLDGSTITVANGLITNVA